MMRVFGVIVLTLVWFSAPTFAETPDEKGLAIAVEDDKPIAGRSQVYRANVVSHRFFLL